jgi:adenylate kinase family enzyme
VNRIAVIGAGGAGKSHLARTLGQRLDLPVIHLDAHYWGPGWRPLPAADWAARQRELVSGDRWVADGTYASTLAVRLERADTIVFLDLPPLLCAWRVLWRRAASHRHPAADLAAGLHPKVDREFLAYVLSFRRRRRPVLLAELARWSHGRTVVMLRSRRAIRRFIAQLPPPA